MNLDWIIEIFKEIIKLKNPFKKRIEQRRLNKRAIPLYDELKPLVFGIRGYLERDYAISITYILKELSRIEIEQKESDKLPIQKTQKFTQLYKRISIISSWFYSFLRELESDRRKVNHNWLLQRTNTLSRLLGELSEVIRDFNTSIKEIQGIPDCLQSDYSRTRDTHNYFLTKYEDFLKKCQREAGEIWTRGFERLQ